jgi:hypothetical protein
MDPRFRGDDDWGRRKNSSIPQTVPRLTRLRAPTDSPRPDAKHLMALGYALLKRRVAMRL